MQQNDALRKAASAHMPLPVLLMPHTSLPNIFHVWYFNVCTCCRTVRITLHARLYSFSMFISSALRFVAEHLNSHWWVKQRVLPLNLPIPNLLPRQSHRYITRCELFQCDSVSNGVRCPVPVQYRSRIVPDRRYLESGVVINLIADE